MVVTPIKTRLFRQEENLVDFILEQVSGVQEGDVVVITSKIVSLAEGRVVELKTPADREKYIKQDSQVAIQTPYTIITWRDGMAMNSAGVDESNAAGKLILLPKDPYATARNVWSALRKQWNLKQLGVIITDSRKLPLRRAAVGVAIGYAGFHGLKFNKGKADLFGRILKSSTANAADPLAAIAVHLMGEANEQCPLTLIRGAQVPFSDDKIEPDELQVEIKDDVYAPLYLAALGNKEQKMNPKYKKDRES